ncbi:MAG: GNAT family N-acetyltransferase [Hymenobacteraceae bacterium]|nr:GNAT family N-acetyltransferase [Hymenobacteraceae bacterium]MDX5482368.1 GNAT family N-acetyltransferase [Hymenobacteraceae bacterium]
MPASLSPTILETERLYLHALGPEQYQLIFDTWKDEDIMQYFGLKTQDDLAAERAKVSEGIKTYFVSFKLFRLVSKQTGAVIGRCDYHTWIRKHRRAEVGYYLFQDSDKGKGYMKEALGAVLAHGFEHMGLHRIEALIASYNEPSLRLVKHFGFTEEGILRAHYVVNGINEDSVMFSLIRADYEKLKDTWRLKTVKA